MTAHGVLCACGICWTTDRFDDDRDGKAITRAAEHDDSDPCD